MFVLMLIEILHTVRGSVRSRELTPEPLLIVGLIASIPKRSRHHPEFIGSDLGGPRVNGRRDVVPFFDRGAWILGSAYFDLCGLNLSASAGPRPDGSERASS
jgi:hypothetical protein